MTDWIRPATLGEACQARADHPDYLLLAGGTDVMVVALHRPDPVGVIDLFGLDGLRGITEIDGGLRIGSGTTYAELIRSDAVRSTYPALHACAQEVGAVQIQERGTLGGNVATSSPVGDTLPALLALDAEVELRSAGGSRRVPYHGFCTGYREIDMQPDELIEAVVLPTPTPGTHQFWRKVGTRKAQAISKVMVAAAGRVEEGKIAHARLAMGAVADRPLRLEAVEALMVGAAPSEELAAKVQDGVRAAITPITDVRSTQEYRLEVAARLAGRFVKELAQ